MAGAVLGAVHGVGAFPPDAVAELETANAHLNLRALARELMGIRR